MKINVVDDIVYKLQCEAMDSIDDEDLIYTVFELHSNGFCMIINMLGIQIWNSDADDREFRDGEVDDYEPLEPFLRKRANVILDKLKLVRF